MNYPITLDSANLYVENFKVGDTVQAIKPFADGSPGFIWTGTVVGTPTDYSTNWIECRKFHQPDEILVWFPDNDKVNHLWYFRPGESTVRLIACAVGQ